MSKITASFPQLINDSSEYSDVVTYITTATGEEYRFVVSLDKECGSVFDSPTMYAATPAAAFDDEAEDIPVDVMAVWMTVKASAVALLMPTSENK